MFTAKYPVLTVVALILLSTLLTEIHIEEKLTTVMDYQSASYLVGIIEQGGVSILLIFFLGKLVLLKEAGFAKPSQAWLLWPIILYTILNGATAPFDGTLTIDTSRPFLLVQFVLIYLSTGLLEEILFRSATLSILLRKWGTSRKNIYWIVLLSNLLFGSLHLINLVMGRRTLISTGAQIIYGTFFGVFFAACFLRNKSIWPAIITHALFDLCGNFSDIAVGSDTFRQISDLTLQDALINILITLPMLIYGLIILRKVEPIQQLPVNSES